jgi:hypothetical protein
MMVGIRRTKIEVHLVIPRVTIQVDKMIEKMLTIPDGMPSKADCFDVYPKPLIMVLEKVEIAPLGMEVCVI